MKRRIFLLAFSTLFLCFMFIGSGEHVLLNEESCSTFFLQHGEQMIAGHNLDEDDDILGSIVINKRNVYKEGITWQELFSNREETSEKPKWTSQYASVTFNPFGGREFPDGGMNEKGLFIWEMSLGETEFPRDESKPKLFMVQWMQYQLDNHETVHQVIKSASEIMLDGWSWHFFTADRNGETASIEFIKGNLVVHTGETMPVTALCNLSYREEMGKLKDYRGFGGDKPITKEKSNIPRFVHAADMTKNYNPDKDGDIAPYGFDILEQLDRGGAKWSIVVDMKNLDVYVRTNIARRIKHLSLSQFDLSNKTPAKMIDIHADLEGDITPEFNDYTPALNRRFVEKSVEAIVKTGFDRMLINNGITAEILIERLAQFPETTINKH